MREIIRYIINMLPYMLISLPILIIVRIGVYLSLMKKRVKVNLHREIGIIVFGLYIIGLASQTIIPKLEFGINGIGIVGKSGIDFNRVNIIPFNKVIETWQAVVMEGYINYLVIEVLGNIGVFSVIGFMLPLLWRKFENLKNTIIICFLISLFIETVQLALPRATDIDDILMNTLGGLIGYGIYNIAKNLLRGFSCKFKEVKDR